jgi:predicted phage gp36 major capsid-like protein
MSSVTVDGVKWLPFLVEYDTQEGTFQFEFYAVDWAHAIDRLEELKATAKVIGEKGGRIEA